MNVDIVKEFLQLLELWVMWGVIYCSIHKFIPTQPSHIFLTFPDFYLFCYKSSNQLTVFWLLLYTADPLIYILWLLSLSWTPLQTLPCFTFCHTPFFCYLFHCLTFLDFIIFHVYSNFQLPTSIFHSMSHSIFHLLSSIFNSLHHSHTSIFHVLTLCSFVAFLFLSLHHLSITPCLPSLFWTTYHIIPCDSVSHFYILHTTPFTSHFTLPHLFCTESAWNAWILCRLSWEFFWQNSC